MLCSLHRALQFGNQYIYQAMPRMLTLWLDYGAKVFEFEKGKAQKWLRLYSRFINALIKILQIHMH